jgi:hypothetical protein
MVANERQGSDKHLDGKQERACVHMHKDLAEDSLVW